MRFSFKVLERLGDKCKLKLIEKIEETASLFSRTLLGQNVCVLLKSVVSSAGPREISFEFDFIYCESFSGRRRGIRCEERLGRLAPEFSGGSENCRLIVHFGPDLCRIE